MPKNMKYDETSKMAGSPKKKGAAETDKQEKKDLKKNMEGGMKKAGDVPGKKGGAKKDIMMDEKMPPPRKKGGAQYKEEGGADHHKGGGKKKGAAGFNSHTSDTHKHPHPEGPSRMGFTQNFGPARQNSYAKGAAKVAEIMGKGAYKKGAADSGHGEPVGHDHPTKTITSREVSGGGSDSSSSSVSNSNIPKATGGEQTKDLSGYMTALNKRFPNTSGADLASKKYISSDMAGNYDSKFRSNSTGSSNPRTVSESSETTVSPMSMSETLKAGEIKTQNRNQNNQYNKQITNITAANDSLVAANAFIDSKQPYYQNDPKTIGYAIKKGSLAAKLTRLKSGDFSPKQVNQIMKNSLDIANAKIKNN